MTFFFFFWRTSSSLGCKHSTPCEAERVLLLVGFPPPAAQLGSAMGCCKAAANCPSSGLGLCMVLKTSTDTVRNLFNFSFSCWSNCCKNLPVMLQEDLYWKKRWCISVAVYELCGQRILYLRGGFLVTSFAEVNLIDLVLLTKWEVEKVSGVIYWTLPRMQIHCTVPYLACLWSVFLLPRRKGRTMEGEAAAVCGECLLTRAVTPVLLKV